MHPFIFIIAKINWLALVVSLVRLNQYSCFWYLRIFPIVNAVLKSVIWSIFFFIWSWKKYKRFIQGTVSLRVSINYNIAKKKWPLVCKISKQLVKDIFYSMIYIRDEDVKIHSLKMFINKALKTFNDTQLKLVYLSFCCNMIRKDIW